MIGVLAQGDVDVETIESSIGLEGTDGWDWITAGGILLASVALAIAARFLIGRVIRRRGDPTIADLVGRVVSYVIVIFGLVYALEGVGVAVGPLLGALGIIGIALAFALKDILENFVASLLLQARRPFSYGDQILSGDTEGTVQLVDSRSVTVLTPDGETVRLPSMHVITKPIVNYTKRGSRRTTIPIGVAYGTDLRRAQEVFLDAVRGVEEVLPSPQPEVLIEGFGESSIDLAVWFWHQPTIADHWRARSEVAFALDETCRNEGIRIPFPQRVLWQGGVADGADDPGS